MAKLLFLQKNLFALEKLEHVGDLIENNENAGSLKRKEENNDEFISSSSPNKRKKDEDDVPGGNSEAQLPTNDLNLFALLASGH